MASVEIDGGAAGEYVYDGLGQRDSRSDQVIIMNDLKQFNVQKWAFIKADGRKFS